MSAKDLKDRRQLRACMLCSIVLSEYQFERTSCPNCQEIMEDSGASVYDYTSPIFEGLVAMVNPKRSWVAKWQRNDQMIPGLYAVQVTGQMSEDVLQTLEMRGIHYRPRDAVAQIRSTSKILENLKKCVELVEKAHTLNAKAIFFPEVSDYIAMDKNERSSLSRSEDASTFINGLKTAAKTNDIHISVSVHLPVKDSHKNYISSLWINKSGDIDQVYKKTHLFHIDPKVAPEASEIIGNEPGNEIPDPVEVPELGKVGQMICFDGRFAELSRIYCNRGATMLSFPSAFTMPTGIAHWETILRARAMETQCFVVAAAQIGEHYPGRRSFGHSMIVDPWGTVIARTPTCNDYEGIAVAYIDWKVLDDCRRILPFNRRYDLYSELK